MGLNDNTPASGTPGDNAAPVCQHSGSPRNFGPRDAPGPALHFGSRQLPVLLFVAVLLVGAVLRFAALGERPVHADEAVQAFIFADLLERGSYVYDPHHYHGPLPHYLNLGLMSALGTGSLAQMEAWHLRLLAALAGCGVIALCALAALLPKAQVAPMSPETPVNPRGEADAQDEGGKGNRQDGGNPQDKAAAQDEGDAQDAPGGKGTVLRRFAATLRCVGVSLPAGGVFWRAGLLAALSPLGLYYSRMGIHETLLVFFALAAPVLAALLLMATATGANPRGAPRGALPIFRSPSRAATSGSCPHADWRDRQPAFLEKLSFFWGNRCWQFVCALLLGVSLGAMQATKETWCIIAFSWLVAACVLAPRRLPALLSPRGGMWWCWLLALVGAVAVSLALYSDFGKNWKGVADAWLTLLSYRTGAGHSGPWFYYLEQIFTFYPGGGVLWGEGVVAFFAVAALLAVLWGGWRSGLWGGSHRHQRLRQNNAEKSAATASAPQAAPQTVLTVPLLPVPLLPRFLALAALVQIAVYSLIAYKTPWLMLVPVAYLVPLAAWGWEVLAQVCRWRLPRACGLALGGLLWALVLWASAAQAWLGSFVYQTDPRVPFVYAPTLPQADAALTRLATQLLGPQAGVAKNAAAFSGSPASTAAVTVVSAPPAGFAAVVGGNYWPLPWYFRAAGDRVGYFDRQPSAIGDFSLLIREGAAGGGMLLELRPGYFLRAGTPAEVLQKTEILPHSGYFRLGE